MSSLFQTFGIPDWRTLHLAMSGEMKGPELADMLPDGP